MAVAMASAIAATVVVGTTAAAAAVIRVLPGTDPQSALSEARTLRRKTPAEPIRIEFTTGTYYLSAPIVLTAADSGSESAPFEIGAAPGSVATLSGGRRLTDLKWRKWRDGIWRTKIIGPPFDRLWYREASLIRARYPNYDARVRPYGGFAADATAPQRVRTWSDPAGGIIHALDSARWGGMHILIEGKDAAGNLVLAAPTGDNRALPPSDTERFVENIFEELDAPGEWYLDGKTSWLYLSPPNWRAPDSTGFVASRLETLIDFQGSASEIVHDVRVSGLRFRHTAFTFLKTTEPLLRSDWKFYRGGAVVIEAAERVAIEGGDFAELGGNAIVVSGHNRRIRLRGNEIHDIGASAIAFVGRPEAVRSPLFEYQQSEALAAIDRTPGPKSDAYPADSIAEDNLIHDIGVIEKQSAGVEIAMSARITVRHNSIYRVPRAGINIGDGSWGGHVITDNDVFDTVLETGDHGAFNSWGRDRYWDPDRQEMNRRVAADRALVALDAVEPITLSHNRFRCDHGWDIDLDDGSSNYIIERNLLLAGGLKLREGFDRTVRNNITVNNTLHPHVWFADSGDVFEHNIVMTGYQPILLDHWGTSLDYNLFPTQAALDRARTKGTDAHSTAGDPRFVAWREGDFSVARDSPALSIGFRNFPMDDFGVVSPGLKAHAERPMMPEPVINSEGRGELPRKLLGMTVKSIETLGEQSAAGLERKQGVLVLEVSSDSPAARAGLTRGDVILRIVDDQFGQSDPIDTAADLVAAYQGRRWRGEIEFEISRGQSHSTIKVDLK
jgi:hypothetical protein